MANNTWNIRKLKNLYLKFKFNWMSYILSGNPTNRMQKRKGRDWNLPQLVGHTETKNKNNINNELKSHHTGYLHRPTSQWENTSTTPNAVARKHSRFPASWFCKCFWETLLIKVPFFSLQVSKSSTTTKTGWAWNNGSRSGYSMHMKSLNILCNEYKG